MKMRKYISYITIAIGLLSFVSCEEWLDEKPQTDLPAEDLFETENGFMSSLAGLYIRMTEEEVYGKNLTFGLVDQLAQMYDRVPDGANSRSSIYIYDQETNGGYNTKGTLANLWQEQYHIIANANNLLKWLDLNGEAVLSDSLQNMMRGEALAIRAYLHFDLLRGWGPMNYAKDAKAQEMKCIPYRTVADNSKQPLLTAKTVVEKIIADLDSAKKLLSYEKDLDLSSHNSGDRHYRFNYHAVNATLARVHNYAGNKEKAKACALDVIENSGRYLLDENNNDPVLSKEVICGLSIHEMEDNLSEYFAEGDKIETKNYINLSTRDKLFETSGIDSEDMRAKSSAFIINNTMQVAMSLKYIDNDNEIIPLIRLPEMYYIACESSEGEDAAFYVNSVRNKRGISRSKDVQCDSEEKIIEALNKEYRKEFYAEGQYFWYLKTHGLTGTLEHNDETTLVEENFIFPLPDREKEFGWTIEETPDSEENTENEEQDDNTGI